MSKTFDQLRKMDEDGKWFLQNQLGEKKGPVAFSVLCDWVARNDILAGDKVSEDNLNWTAAEAVPGLHMNWMAKQGGETMYGPFSLLAVPHLLAKGIISDDTRLVNKVTAKELNVAQIIGQQREMSPISVAMRDEKAEPRRHRQQDEPKLNLEREAQLTFELEQARGAAELANKDLAATRQELVKLSAKSSTRQQGEKSTEQTLQMKIQNLEAEAHTAMDLLEGASDQLDEERVRRERLVDEYQTAERELKKTVAELESKLTASNDEITSTKLTMDSWHEEIDRLKGANSEKEDVLKKGAGEWEEKIAELNSRLGQAESKIEEQRAQNDAASHDAARGQQELQQRVKQLEEEAQAAEQLLDEVQDQLEKEKRSSVEAIAMERDSEKELARRADRLEAEKNDLAELVAKARDEAMRHKVAFEKSRTDGERKESELAATASALKKEAEGSAYALQKVEKELNETTEVLDQLKTREKGAESVLKTELAELQKKAVSSEASLDTARKALSESVSESARLCQDADSAKAKLAGQVKDLTKQLTEAGLELNDAREQLGSLDSTRKTLNVEMQEKERGLKQEIEQLRRNQSNAIASLSKVERELAHEKEHRSKLEAQTREKAETVDQRSKQLKEESRLSSEMLGSLKKRLAEHEKTIAQLKAEGGEQDQTLEKERSSLQQSLKAKAVELGTVEREIADLARQNNVLEEEARRRETEMRARIEELEKASASSDEKRSALDAATKAGLATKQELERKSSEQSNQIAELKQEIEQAKVETQEATKQRESSQTQHLQQLEQELAAKESELDTVRAAVDQERSLRDKDANSVAEKESEFHSSLDALTAKRDTEHRHAKAREKELRERIAQLEHDVAAGASDIENARLDDSNFKEAEKQREAEHRGQIELLEKRLSHSTHQCEELQQAAQRENVLRAEVAESGSQKSSELNARLMQLQKDLKDATSLLDTAEQDFAKQGSALESLKHDRDSTVGDLNSHIATLKSELDENAVSLQKAQQSLDDKSGDVMKLAQARDKKEQDLALRIAALEKTEASFMEEIDMQRTALDQLQASSSTKESELSNVISDLKSQVAGAGEYLDQERKTSKRLISELDEMRMEATKKETELSDQLAGIRSELDARNQEFAGLREEHIDLETTHKEVLAKGVQLESDSASLREQLEASNACAKQLQQQHSELETNHKVASEKKNALSSDYTSLREEHAGRLGKIDKLQQQLEQSETERQNIEQLHVESEATADSRIAEMVAEAQAAAGTFEELNGRIDSITEESAARSSDQGAKQQELESTIVDLRAQFQQASVKAESASKGIEEEKLRLIETEAKGKARVAELTEQIEKLENGLQIAIQSQDGLEKQLDNRLKRQEILERERHAKEEGLTREIAERDSRISELGQEHASSVDVIDQARREFAEQLKREKEFRVGLIRRAKKKETKLEREVEYLAHKIRSVHDDRNELKRQLAGLNKDYTILAKRIKGEVATSGEALDQALLERIRPASNLAWLQGAASWGGRHAKTILVVVLLGMAAIAIPRMIGGNGSERSDGNVQEERTEPDGGQQVIENGAIDNPRTEDQPDLGVTPQPIPQPDRWPALEVAGIELRPQNDLLNIVFKKAAFSSLTRISSETSAMLRDLANQLRDHMPDYRIIVVGHTDSVPVNPNGRYPTNKDLALARAVKVRAYLETECGLPAESLGVAAAGELDPPFPNDTPAGMRKNRTVVLKLVARSGR